MEASGGSPHRPPHHPREREQTACQHYRLSQTPFQHTLDSMATMTPPPPQTRHSPHRTATTSVATAAGTRHLPRPTCHTPPPARCRSGLGHSAPSRKCPPVSWVASTADAKAASAAAAAAAAAATACSEHGWGWWAVAALPPPTSHPTPRGPTDHLAALTRAPSLAPSRTPRPRACTFHKQLSRRRAVQLVGTQSDTHAECTHNAQLRRP